LFEEYGEAMADLEVRRSSLEDTYLSQVHRAESGLSEVASASNLKKVVRGGVRRADHRRGARQLMDAREWDRLLRR